MNKNVIIAFTEPKDGGKQREKIRGIIAGGFYKYLKQNGHFKQDPEKQEKIQQTLEESRRICHEADPVDSA